MPPEPNQRFPKQARITHQRDFELVFRSGQVAADNVLVVHAIRSASNRSRLGISISRRVGNAVVRNRWKRLIREAFRRQQDLLPPGLDMIIRPKRGAVPDHDAIRRSIIYLSKKLDRRLTSTSQ